jgi:hypothetical protein
MNILGSHVRAGHLSKPVSAGILDENENTVIVKVRGKLPVISVKNYVMTYGEVKV